MQKDALVKMMLDSLKETLTEEGSDQADSVSATSPLVGAQAVVSSLGLVSLIVDIETTLADEHDMELTLVSEDALSRKESPFRTIDALADYVFELRGTPVESDA